MNHPHDAASKPLSHWLWCSSCSKPWVACVALGLFTRFFAAAITIEMAVIAYHHLPKFGWTGPGYEYPLMWGLIMLAVAVRGGGPFSIDRRIGKEL